MIRISEEQKAILNCYSGMKEEVAAELGRAMPFIEDPELREISMGLFKILPVISEREFVTLRESILIDQILSE